MRAKEKILDEKAATRFLRGWAQRFLPGWKIEIVCEERKDGNAWATTWAYPLDREVVFVVYTPVRIRPGDYMEGLPKARASWEAITFHEIAHAQVSLPMQALTADVMRIKEHLPPALAEDFEHRVEDYEEGIVNCLAVCLALAVEDKVD